MKTSTSPRPQKRLLFGLPMPDCSSCIAYDYRQLIDRYNEMRLLIRHPSMGRLSPSPGFFAESLSICAEASRNILSIINRFRDFRQLECHPQVNFGVYRNNDRAFQLSYWRVSLYSIVSGRKAEPPNRRSKRRCRYLSISWKRLGKHTDRRVNCIRP